MFEQYGQGILILSLNQPLIPTLASAFGVGFSFGLDFIPALTDLIKLFSLFGVFVLMVVLTTSTIFLYLIMAPSVTSIR